MSNLSSAASALQSELAHARQGQAYYETRVAALEAALQALTDIDNLTADAARPPRRTQKRAAKSPRQNLSTSPLPSTGNEFWLDLIGKEALTGAEIFQRAHAHLGGNLPAAERRALRQRMSATLASMSRDGKYLKSSGSGRSRTYSRV